MLVLCLSATPLDRGTFVRRTPVIDGRTRWLFRAVSRLATLSFAVVVFSLLAAPVAAAPLTRVARVVDSRTIVLDGGNTVTLRGVDVPPADEAMAAEYLGSLLGNAWVLVENGGDVYRSPDALYVNGQLITHAYRGTARMTYLGESMPGPRARTVAPAPRAMPVRSAPPRRAHHHAPRQSFVPRKAGV